MKAIVGLLLAVLLANNGVHAIGRRELHNSVSVSASATSRGGASASASASGSSSAGSEPTAVKATSVADGCGADATTVATGKDGADVDAKTTAKSKDCANVKAKTVAKGEGEDADVKVETTVKSDKDIDVTVLVKRFSDGESVDTVAVEIVKTYGGFVYKRVSESLLALAADSKTFPLFEKCLLLLLEQRQCKEFKLVVVGYEDSFFKYTLPVSVTACLSPSCSNYGNAKDCCGKAQLEQDQCSCKDGSCAWAKPEVKYDNYAFWMCNDCGHEVRMCSCT